MSAATKAASARYEMLTNVPVVMDIKYCDVWPDKNGYGSQVSLKGVVDGETVTIYLKGKAWANLKALLAAGVIANYDKENEEPAEKVNIPVADGMGVTLCRRQLAGEKYANLAVATGRSGVSHVAPSTARHGVDIGGPIPGLDDVEDDLPPVEQAYERVGSVQPHPSGASPAAVKLAGMFALYDACFKHAMGLYEQNRALVGVLDVSAMTAALYIQANQRGVSL